MDINASSPWKYEDEQEESSAFTDKKILRMMKMMGYQSGFGLGKNKQGITEPVEMNSQVGKRGLGLKTTNLKLCNEQWDFSSDTVTAVEHVEWLHNDSNFAFDEENMMTWCKEQEPVLSIENEFNFCDKDVLHGVIQAKNIFEELDIKQLCQARARANPFETIRSVFFMNRAALKIANIDAATDFMFTNVDQDPFHKTTSGPYYFADICSGPGGFTEYVLWRKKWMFKGFGFTLRGEHDFKLTESVCASPVTFSRLYGINDDGNVCCPANIDDFTEKVLFETEQQGVHFVMSDGGFSVEGNENIQEILSKNIYICQCLVALEILRKHGHFVTKLFDIFTSFSVGLLFLMYNCFEKICILKPNSSRPANSERYVIFSNYNGTTASQQTRKYLSQAVKRLWELKDNRDLDITEIVPLAVITTDHQFYSYIVNSNNRIARHQTMSLQKLGAFCKNPFLVDYRQDHLRKLCLEHWRIPDKPKEALPKFSVDDLLSETIETRELLLVQPREICLTEKLDKFIQDIHDWHYSLLHSKKNTTTCNFYAGVRSSKVYRLQCNKWVKVKNLELPCGTLLYGEFVKEKETLKLQPSGKTTCDHKYSLHIIDALQLGDFGLANFKFEERQNFIRIYCKSVNHELQSSTLRIRPKTINKLSSLLSANIKPTKDQVSGSFISCLPVLGHNVKDESYEVNSILLLKTNEGQSFHSTYVLRIQLFGNDAEEQGENALPFKQLVDFVKNKNL